MTRVVPGERSCEKELPAAIAEVLSAGPRRPGASQALAAVRPLPRPGAVVEDLRAVGLLVGAGTGRGAAAAHRPPGGHAELVQAVVQPVGADDPRVAAGFALGQRRPVPGDCLRRGGSHVARVAAPGGRGRRLGGFRLRLWRGRRGRRRRRRGRARRRRRLRARRDQFLGHQSLVGRPSRCDPVGGVSR